MTIKVGSLGEMAIRLIATEVVMYEFLGHALDRVLEKIEKTAKSEFGVYQGGAGPFGEWPELADATQEDRARQGYPANEPLLRESELRDSIEHEREGLEGAVGSTSEIMPFHEFGTSKMPARPVLGPAAFRNKGAIQKLIGAAVVAGLIGGEQIHEALGYDFVTRD